MKFLKACGWVVLYTLIFFASSVLAGVFLASLHVLLTLAGLSPNLPDIFILLCASAVLLLGFGGLTLVMRGIKPLKYLRFKAISIRDGAASLVMGIGFALFITSLLTMIKFDTLIPDPVSQDMLEAIMANFPAVLLAVGIIVPVYEEVFFRGLVFNEVKGVSRPWVALVVQGLIFGAFHLNWFQFTYTVPAGIILGLVYLRYQSIWAPILIHLGWNSTSTILSALLPERVSAGTFYALMLLGAILLFITLFYSFKIRPRTLEGPEPGPISVEPVEREEPEYC